MKFSGCGACVFTASLPAPRLILPQSTSGRGIYIQCWPVDHDRELSSGEASDCPGVWL